MSRFQWLVMFVLLVGSFVGATWAVTHSVDLAGNPESGTSGGAETPNYIIASGHVDVSKGVTDLYPRQAGLVMYVSEENKKVGKGDVLLQIDDRLAEAQVDEAKADLKVAEESLQQAEQLAKQFPLKLEQQKQAIAALEHKRKAVDAEAQAKINIRKDDVTISQNIKTGIAEALGQVDSLIKVEESKLEELKLVQPDADIKRASYQIDAKKATLRKAQAALELYKVRAPSDGFVLRTLTRVGEVLGPAPKLPALQFREAGPLIVRAEVLQEWGSKVKEKQKVVIEDDSLHGHTWAGQVESISSWYAPTRSPIIEPFRANDVRTLECIVDIDGPDQGLRIGQRVRVKIGM